MKKIIKWPGIGLGGLALPALLAIGGLERE